MEAVAEVDGEVANSLNSIWVLLAAFMVFLMQPGFALFESGLHAAKNTVNVLMKNICDFVFASFGFWALGFAFMFGDGNPYLGTSGFFLNAEGFSSLAGGIPIPIIFFFHLVFAGATATIVSGAIGGRVKFTTYMAICIFLVTFLYPILGHWLWGGGWLSELGFYDFAGSTVVHAVGGCAALAAAIAVGPRIGRFNADGSVNVLPGTNMTMVGTGVFILWFAWFGFNAGSTLSIVGQEDLVAHILITTNMSAIMGGITAMFFAWRFMRKPDVTMTLNGVLAGLVGITAGCAFVGVVDALIIGVVSGGLVFYSCFLMDKLRIEDAVGAFPVHGLCGIWGTVAVGLFGRAPYSGGEGSPKLGLFHGGGIEQVGIQLLGTLVIGLLAFVLTYSFIKIAEKFMGLRVAREEEIQV